MNTAFLTAMFVGVHSTTNAMQFMGKLSLHCVLTEMDGGARFVMGPYSSLRNVSWMILANKTQQTAWSYVAQIHLTFLAVVAMSR